MERERESESGGLRVSEVICRMYMYGEMLFCSNTGHQVCQLSNNRVAERRWESAIKFLLQMKVEMSLDTDRSQFRSFDRE